VASSIKGASIPDPSIQDPSFQDAPAFVRLAGHPLRWRLLTELAHSDLRVRELVSVLGQPQNLVSYHLRLLRDGGLVTVNRSSFDGRDSYYHLDLDRCAQALADTGAALHPALNPAVTLGRVKAAPVPPPRLSVLFVCTGNSARSPIAEALLSRHTASHTASRIEAISAGSHPKPGLHPNAVRVLREHFGINHAGQRPQHLDRLSGRRFDYVITLCDKAREVRLEFGDQARRVHWSIPDPAAGGASDQVTYPIFTRTAVDIDTRVRHLLPVLAPAGRPTARQ
jgi:protein-tyrosine-phosphatase/DNA-binding transcriptional ArsR family regulator